MTIYLESSNTICSLGFSTQEVYENITKGKSGITIKNYPHLWNKEFPASTISNEILDEKCFEFKIDKSLPRFDKLILCSANLCMRNSKIDFSNPNTRFVLSTTKGNIDKLDEDLNSGYNNVNLWNSAKLLGEYFNNPNPVTIVSNACVSGSMAMLVGKRMINSNTCENVVVVGADVLSRFIVSGFQSFHSLSSQGCRPFDKDRDGLTLGEGAATVVLSKDKLRSKGHILLGGATSNDANHISGPSRTGEGLLLAIENTIKNGEKIDLISAHGTATPYNDDMESKAIYRANLDKVPVNSLKSYIGHTLGAAGILESLINLEALTNNLLIESKGMSNQGVAEEINIIKKTETKIISTMLKLVSGFGGCNTAILFKKYE